MRDFVRFCAPDDAYTAPVNMDPLTGRFFSDPACKRLYKATVRRLLLRRNSITGVLWRDDPAIMAWCAAS